MPLRSAKNIKVTLSFPRRRESIGSTLWHCVMGSRLAGTTVVVYCLHESLMNRFMQWRPSKTFEHRRALLAESRFPFLTILRGVVQFGPARLQRLRSRGRIPVLRAHSLLDGAKRNGGAGSHARGHFRNFGIEAVIGNHARHE